MTSSKASNLFSLNGNLRILLPVDVFFIMIVRWYVWMIASILRNQNYYIFCMMPYISLLNFSFTTRCLSIPIPLFVNYCQQIENVRYLEILNRLSRSQRGECQVAKERVLLLMTIIFWINITKNACLINSYLLLTKYILEWAFFMIWISCTKGDWRLEFMVGSIKVGRQWHQ